MTRSGLWVLLLLALPAALSLTGCYSDQKRQLASCEAGAIRGAEGQPLKSIQACMDKAGYRFTGWDNTGDVVSDCDMGALIKGAPSQTGTDAHCFEPKGWLALKIYRIEVPVRPPA